MHSHEAPGLVWFVFAWVPVLLVMLGAWLVDRMRTRKEGGKDG